MIHTTQLFPSPCWSIHEKRGWKTWAFLESLYSCSGNLLSGPSQKALKENHNGSEVIGSWHYLCYYYVLLFATVLFQLKETACSLRCSVFFEMTWVIKLPQSSGSRDKSLWLLAAVYLRYRGGHRGQVKLKNLVLDEKYQLLQLWVWRLSLLSLQIFSNKQILSNSD